MSIIKSLFCIPNILAYPKTLFFFIAIFLIAPKVFSQECGYVYVTPNGASSGVAGTKTNPANLAYGLILTDNINNIVRLGAGTYNFSSEFNMISDITLEGGFDASTWIKSNATPSVFHRDAGNVLSNPSRIIAVYCYGISNFKLMDITINMDDAQGNGISTYGIYLNGCSNYTISRCIINAGDAADGYQGLQGAQGITGDAGGPGESGSEQGDCCRQPGLSGSGSFFGSNAGGDGGLGAKRPLFDVDTIFGLCYSANFRTEDGYAGYPGLGMGGSSGGIGGIGVCELVEYVAGQCAAVTSNHGAPGATGNTGYNGLHGVQAYGTYSIGFYFPSTGSLGTQGTHGGGGGGGGGGGAKGCEPIILNPQTCDTIFWSWGTGGGGGGGGEGGQGGFPGLGGDGGGGSFCIFSWSNGMNGKIRDCYLSPGQAGSGAFGGTGGDGGLGGLGGFGGTTGANFLDSTRSCNTGEGGNGGEGGVGGIGGEGGDGSIGVSLQIYEDTAGYPMLVSNAYNSFEPVIFVSFSGCSNNNIIFNTTAIGNIDWMFGFGANPGGSNNAIDTIQYDSGAQGPRTITLIVDGVPYSFANYITLNTDFSPPEIIASDTIICNGDAMTLSSTGIAASYSWSIPGGSVTTSSVQNPGAIIFNTPGTYQISLTSTSCCGTSYTEQEIEVISSVNVDLGPDTSVCFTDILPTLNAGNPGASYAWTLDGSPIGNNAPTLQASTPGTYAVTVSYGSCSNSDEIEFSVYTSLPVDLGGDTAICIYDTFPILDAGLNNMNYNWMLDGNPIGTNTKTLQTTIPGTYSVSVTSSTGCFGIDSLTLAISEPTVELGSNKSICDNEPYPILDAGNPGSSYSWFLDGLPIGGNTQTLLTSAGGTYSVFLVNQYGCIAGDSIDLAVFSSLIGAVTVPSPVYVGALATFTDNSSPGPISWSWNFGDGSNNDTIQNTTHIYTTAGIYPVFLVVGNTLCYDTVTTTIEVLNDCNTLGLSSSFTPVPDTIDLAGLGIASFLNTSVNAISYVWDFGDGSAPSTLKDPNHTYMDTGFYAVTLTSYNYNCTDSITYSIVVINSTTLPPVDTSDTTTGFDNLSNLLFNLNVYPNPNDGLFIMEANLQKHKQYTIEIINLLGQPIMTEKTFNSEKYFREVVINNTMKGLYYIRIQSDEKTIIRKIVTY